MDNLTITDMRCNPGDSAFLIDNGTTSILCDSGFGFTGFQIADNIKQQLGDRKLDYIFLTHSHYDHALGSAYILRYYPDAKVAAGRHAAEIFKRDGAKRLMKELDNKIAAACGITDYEFLADELRVDIICDDGNIINAGDMTFEVLDLPGHTNCSVGYYCKDLDFLIAPESLGAYDGEFNILPSFLVSYKAAVNSIERVLKLQPKKILSPHFGELNKKQTSYFLENMKSATETVAKEIIEGIKSGKSDQEIINVYKEKYWYGALKETYPIDALNLNTSIMINLVRKELLS